MEHLETEIFFFGVVVLPFPYIIYRIFVGGLFSELKVNGEGGLES